MNSSVTPGLNLLGAREHTGWRVSETQVNLARPHPEPRPVTIMAGSRAITIDLARSAAIVVDMQNDFCHPSGWLAHIGVDVSHARKPISALTRLLPDLRNAGVPVVWVNWGNRPDKLNLPPGVLHVYNPTGAGVGICDPLPSSGAHVLEAGSWSAAIVDELEVSPEDVHVAKYRMSGFQGTVLDAILRNLGVTTLLFAGVNSDQCVMYTLQDANSLGYDCILLADCIGTTSPDYCHKGALYNVNQCYGFVTESSSILNGLSRNTARVTSLA